MRGKDMKMKNLVKTFVLAFGTLASALAVEAGDIFSIEPISGSCEPSSALKSGQKLQFRMRLIARDWEAEKPGEWQVTHVGLSSKELDDVMFPPKVGIVISGQLRFADIYDMGQKTDKGSVYTDLLLEYKVQPGDFALPVNLALATSTRTAPKIPGIDETEAASGYYVANVVGADVTPRWQFMSIDVGTGTTGTETKTNVCDFTWWGGNLSELQGASMLPGGKMPTVDATLAKAKFYVKSIDFDDDNPNYDPDDAGTYWRTVHEGTTETVPAPTIETIGISSTNAAPIESVRLYVWAEDEDVAFMDGVNVTKKTMRLPPDGATTGERRVYTFDLVTGIEKYPIKFKGKTRGQSTKLILSATPDYVYYQSTGSLVTNFLSRTIFVDEPPKPNIKIGWDPEGQVSLYPDVVTAFSNDWSEVAEQGIPLYVIPSEPFETDTTMHLKAKIAKDEVTDYEYVFTNKLIGTLSGERQSYTTPQVETNVTFRAGDKTAKIFWVYPAGGTTETKNPGVQFTVEFDAATPSTYDNLGKATLRFQDPKPTIVSPTTSDSFTFSGGNCTIPVVVMDSYRDLSEPRTYTVQVIANGTVLCTSNEVPFRSGESTAMVLNSSILAKLQGPEAKEMKLTVKVTDPMNQSATSEVVQLLVPAKEKTPTVSAVLYDTSGTTSPHDGNEFEEGQIAYVRFVLEPEASERPLHAFLVPRNAASSNLVEIAKAVRDSGILIQATKTNSTAAAALTLLDGTSLTDGSSGQIEFDIVLKDDDGNVDETYVPASPALTLTVKNVLAKPEENGLYVNGAPEAVRSGGELVDEIASGASQTFIASYGDVSLVDVTNGIVTVWCFTDGKKGGTYHYFSVTSKTESATIEHTFNTAGATQKVMFFAVDKDTLAEKAGDGLKSEADLKSLWTALSKIMSPYTVTVHVGDAPQILVGVEELTFDEKSKTAKLPITLSQAYDDVIYLKATAKPMISGADNPGHVSFKGDSSTVWLTVPANETEPKREGEVYSGGLLFDYAHLDGTAFSAGDGWEITLEAYEENDDGDKVKLTRYADASAYVMVLNAPPDITKPSGTSVTTNKSITVNEAFTLTWAVKDVAADFGSSTDGLTARWYIDDIEQGDKKVTGIKDNNERSTTLTLREDGSHVVRLEVTDKDEDENGKASREWYYYISPTKMLEVRATGPSTVTKTKYLTAGKGRVWADGIKGTADEFCQSWTYNVKANEATVHAYGYASSNTVYRDDGTLGGKGRDFAIDRNGNSSGIVASADCYEYDGEYDNFFYRWAVIGAGENGGATGVTYSEPRPTVTATADVSEEVALDTYEENKESYAKSRVEAIFARELYPEDNLGDINQDGIPDLYVQLYKFNVISAEGTLGGDDLAELDDFNEDEDYLPSTETSSYGSIIPDLKETWVTLGTPFSAKLEIRGYGEGLNNAPSIIGQAAWKPDVSTNTFTRVEYLAWRDAGAPTLADGKTPDLSKWSPECPTDPTKPDTDKDGLPDGYEYWFWYRAHVGYMEGDTHKYLTGRRYNPMDPANPTIITASEIEEIMNPRVPGDFTTDATDTDNDGLPDKIEFEIGTNPFDYDTDNDGLPDGYEVAISLTDPLLTSNGYVDSLGNPDDDVMAFEYAENAYYVYGFLTENNELVYRAFRMEALDGVGSLKPSVHTGTVSVVQGELLTNGWTFVDGLDTNKCFYTTADLEGKWYVNDAEKVVLTVDLPEAETWRLRGATNDTLGLPAYVVRGTVLDGEPVPVTEEKPVKTEKMQFADYYDPTNILEDLTFKRKQPPPNRAYAAFQYGERRFDVSEKPNWGYYAVCGDAEVGKDWKVVYKFDVKNSPVYLIHAVNYQDRGFDPRTAWSVKNVKSRAYTTYDEYLLMAYWRHMNAREDLTGLTAADIAPTARNPWTALWAKYLTDPNKADSDDDGMPDGWELYVMGGPMSTLPKELTGAEGVPGRGVVHPLASYSPIVSYAKMADKAVPDSDSLDFVQEFCGVETVAAYEGVETIVDVHPEWRNKKYATDPWNADTDGDGLPDGEEGTLFVYGDPAAEGASGGGLNPCSWDTDGDGLPDPWEAEFAGHLVEGEATTKTETKVDEESGRTNTVTTILRAAGSWEGGMDGTVADANLDYDYDGLQNWQEYMAGTVRAWRYDDTVTPWDYAPMLEEDPPSPYDEEAWGKYWWTVLVDEQSRWYNPHLVSSSCDNGAPYMSLCTNEWDSASGKWYYFKDGVYHDLQNPPPRYRFKSGDETIVFNRFTYKVYTTWRALMIPFDIGMSPNFVVYPKKYICCDPRLADTDGDGMDDFYECFHGMDPLLGADGVKGDNVPKDLIWEAYGNLGSWSAKNNYWLNGGVDDHAGELNPLRESLPYDAPDPWMDFVTCPWLAGLADADPDGDDINNQLEAIMPNMQAVSTFLHTDPTPLWLTDTTFGYSLPNLYYPSTYGSRSLSLQSPVIYDSPDGFWYDSDNDGVPEYHKFEDFGYLHWDEKKLTVTPDPYLYNYYSVETAFFWSFEEEEGYDTDHDFLGDYEESMGKTTSASDPKDSDQPRRRQAMYFDGERSLLSHPNAIDEKVPSADYLSEARQTYLYYTVECWAKAEDPTKGPQTLVERTCLAGEANPGDQRYVRKNFHIGIRNGRWYTKFDTPGTGEKSYVEITDGTQATTNWTHVAASFDGKALRLYVNGVCVKSKPCGFQPVHSVTILQVNSLQDEEEGSGLGGILKPELAGYEPVVFTVGASVATSRGIFIDYNPRINPMAPPTNFGDYDGYFKGYIDEVRIWDGARKDADILADVTGRVRYDRELALKNRDAVYAAWRQGATRLTPADTTDVNAKELPAELMHHWAFDQVAGAVKPEDAMKAPYGFSNAKTVVDSRAVWSRPDGWMSPWWAGWVSGLASTVYTDWAYVPWITDTVAHLPRLDLTTVDSAYWSENYAGDKSATSLGYTRFAFPRSCESVGHWNQIGYTLMLWSDPMRSNVVGGDDALHEALRFTLRNKHVWGDDLVPLGTAYARRISAAEGGMWDEQGAADAWGDTKADLNIDYLPDWWVSYARLKYFTGKPTDSIGWDTEVYWPTKQNGQKMPAWQAYLRDLARGMLPDKKVHPEYADTRDLDGDKLPDWWEDLYGVQGNKATDGMEDPDHDGLSNYQEWLCSEGDKFGYGIANGYPALDPKLAHSSLGQVETDYFLKHGDLYLGEILADHDMMEDDNEDEMGTDRTVYDAWSDKDEDGWTAWSEMRYATYKMSTVTRLVSHMVGTEEFRDAPVPVVHATLRYNGTQTAAPTAPVVIEAYAGNNLTKKPTATYVVRPGESMTNYVYIGAWEDRVVHGTLTPGHVQAGFDLVSIEGAFIQSNDRFSWKSGENSFSGTYEDLQRALADDPELTVSAKAFDGEWDRIVVGSGSDGRNIIQLTVDQQTQKGWLLVDNKRAGTVDLVTGDFTLDLSTLTGAMEDSGINLDQYIYRLGYYTRIPTLQTKALSVSLASASTGALKEGATAFTAFIDLNGNLAYDPGEPIGFAKDVEIGYDQVPELTIELTDKSAAAGERFAYGNDVETLRIIRAEFNGNAYLDEECTVPVKRRIVYNRDATVFDRKTVFEGDLVTAGKFGLDWSGLRNDILSAGLQLKDVTSVTYQIVKNAQSVEHVDAADVIGLFTVSFPAQPTKPTAVSPSAKSMPIVETTRPTFSWSGTEENTAFALMICDAAGKEVWSNTNTLAVLPPRDASGNYTWTAPVWIGTNVCGDAWVLDNGSNYTWQVAMFNQKFSSLDDAKWSDPAEFRTALATDNDFTTSYGTAKVTVRYFGPATNDLSSVLVCLYRTADFTGVPAARTRLFDVDGAVDGLATNAVEVTFLGLPSGDYYACAYVDRNGNLKRDRWETWGYANQIGLGLQAIYTPTAIAVDAKNAKVPSAEVYLEDTDVNQDDVPDCLTEDESILAAASVAAMEDGTKDDDGDGLTADEEASDSYTDPTKWDTDEDGMPDGWETRFADLDPLFADAGAVADGDVMAYAEVTYQRVTDKANVSYLVNPTNRAVRVGDTLTYDQLVATYDYGGKCGVGTNLSGTATFRVDKVEPVTAVLVHAQVFDAFGFNQRTAVPAKLGPEGEVIEDSVNTKEFTALDKYLVVRYLEAQGLANEETMNLNKTPGMQWKDVTLKPLDLDNDRDGVSDGWELYVMFGTNGVGIVTNASGTAVRATSLAQVKISPWNFEDARTDFDLDGDGLNVLGEFNGGFAPMNPWNAHTLSDAIDDYDAFEYNIASADTQLADDDNDGLSNWAEYLASKVYGFGDFHVDDAYSAEGDVLDYFVIVSEGDYAGWYVGEVVADHDFMEDVWEDKYDVEFANRYVWDALADGDGDGWSNWAEARSGTDPSSYGRLSLVRSDGSEQNVVDEFPIPRIHMQLSYDSDKPFVSPIVVKAWSGSSVNGAADAIWHVAGATAEGEEADVRVQSRFLGLNPGKKVYLNIGPGAIAEGHVRLEFYDPRYSTEHLTATTNEIYDVIYAGKKCTHTYTFHSIDSSSWTGGNWWPDFPSDKRFGVDTGVIKYGSEELASSGNYSDAAYEVVGNVNYRTGDVEIDFTSPSLASATFTSTAPTGEGTYDRNHYNLVRSYWRISWVSKLISGGKVKTFTLQKPDLLSSESFGHLSEGINTFIAFADDNGNGEWDSGEPFGIARDVDVGWDRTTVAIELTDDAAAFTRFSVAGLASAAAAAAAGEGAEGKTSDPVIGSLQRVRILRTAVNGQPLAKQRMVFTKLMDLTTRDWLAENDFIKPGHWDFDDRYLLSDAATAGIAAGAVRTVDYLIYVGDGRIEEIQPAARWTKEFTVERVAPTATSPTVRADYRVLSAQPTLCWKGPDGYTAFALEIATNDTFEADAVIYSITNYLPAATEDGYAFKAPVYAGKELAYGGRYWWRVCELNAKFMEVGDWSDPAEFEMAASSENADTGYGPVAAQVRYYGPSTNVQAQVLVGVYESADFTGVPVALKVLGDADEGVTNLAWRTDAEEWTKAVTNVAFDGIAPGTYYVMAFVDANGNGVRDNFETWGYANGIGTAVPGAFYEPQGVKVLSTKSNLPSVVIYMEDTDCNQDGIPDCLQPMSLFATKTGDGNSGDSDKDGTSDKEEDDELGTDKYELDTDKDGMPDGWESRFAETDPLNEDGDIVEDGDVMAYALVDRIIVTLSDDTAYLLPATADRPTVGDLAKDCNGGNFELTYDYGEAIGLGLPTNIVDETLTIREVQDVKVVLVHSQVYDEFGYDSKTANPLAFADGTSVNTKPFTALDKYLVWAYLRAIGYTAETDQTPENWSRYSLKPGDPDNNRDGVADGWQLYTMFGPNDAVATATAWTLPAAAREQTAGGEGLTFVQEYDGGHWPTDPWAYDTDNDGVTDFYAYEYHLKGDESGMDFDGDGLSNDAEYLISEVFRYAQLDPDNPKTDGYCVDYFRKVGDLYLGEIFTDHDQVDDLWEAEHAETGANPYVFDPEMDFDGNGWSSYAEYRASESSALVEFVDVLTNGDIVVTNRYHQRESVLAGHPVPTLKAHIRFDNRAVLMDSSNAVFTIRAFTDRDAPDATWLKTLPRAEFEKGEVTIELKQADKGYVREGLNDFVCYLGEDSIYAPDVMPFGTASGVDVGWSGTEFTIGLTRTSAITPRVDIWSGISDRGGYIDEETYGEYDSRNPTGESGALSGLNLELTTPGKDSVRVRVARYAVDGFFTYSCGVNNRVVLDRYFTQNVKFSLSEADFLSSDEFDIDWRYLKDEVVSALSGYNYEVTNVSYLVVLGDGPVGFTRKDQTNESDRVTALLASSGESADSSSGASSGESSEGKPVIITRRFERVRSLPKAIGLAEGAVLHGSRPTFVWSMPNEEEYAKRFGTSYTAFRIQILDKDMNKLLWTSDVTRAPEQDKDGRFVWSAPLYAGDQTANVVPVFKAAGNYQWRVSMYNAKFLPADRIADDLWSEVSEFSTSVDTQQETDDNGYSSIDVAVKYTGPEVVLAKCGNIKTAEGMVRIQAFASADFSGDPVAQGFVANKAALTDTTDVLANGRLIGLKNGTYYVRAYIDSNGNFKKDDWESWGQVKGAVEVKSNQLAPIVGLYIEDADTDKDWVPDAYEYLYPDKYEIGRSDASIDPEGKIILKDTVYDGIIEGTAGISRFLSGATMTFFQNFEAAKLLLGIDGGTDTTTIDAIRRAVEKNIEPDSVKITSLVVDAGNGTNGKVILTVGAKATDSVAGYLLSPVYVIPTSTTVEIKVYRKENLATANWGDPVKTETVTIDGSTMDERIEVPLAGVDFNSGFYKVEIVQ